MTDVPAVTHSTRLRDRTGALAVWGMGYIGASTALAFAEAGVGVIGYDVDPSRVLRVRETAPANVTVTADARDVLVPKCCVHMIGVPTERDGQPATDALLDTVSQLARAISGGDLAGTCPLVIVESTLTPGVTDALLIPAFEEAGLVVGVDVLLGLAPRRDWFLAEGFGLRELDRIYSGVGDRSADAILGVLGLVNDVLHRAPTYREGELVKTVENAYRHLDITLANELTLAFPDADMREILRLAATKWNIGNFHPSLGTGGYCIPLAPRYLLEGAPHPEQLGLISRAIETDGQMPVRIAEAVQSNGPVVVLGIAYKGGLKVDILSPASAIVRRLRQHGTPVTVHDPLYDDAEIAARLGTGLTTKDIGSALRIARTVIVVPDHPEFRLPEYVDAINAYRPHPVDVFDNQGVFGGVAWAEHVSYRRPGTPRWLETTRSGE